VIDSYAFDQSGIGPIEDIEEDDDEPMNDFTSEDAL